MKTMNEWFLSLPGGRQKVLREDKWMLAEAAFEAGKQNGDEDKLDAFLKHTQTRIKKLNEQQKKRQDADRAFVIQQLEYLIQTF